MSEWQRGCNDAKAGRPPYYFSEYSGEAARGYLNGYSFGMSLKDQQSFECDECEGTGLDPELPTRATCPVCDGSCKTTRSVA